MPKHRRRRRQRSPSPSSAAASASRGGRGYRPRRTPAARRDRGRRLSAPAAIRATPGAGRPLRRASAISGEPSARSLPGANASVDCIPDRLGDIAERHELHRRIAVDERRSPGNGCKAAQQRGAAIGVAADDHRRAENDEGNPGFRQGLIGAALARQEGLSRRLPLRPAPRSARSIRSGRRKQPHTAPASQPAARRRHRRGRRPAGRRRSSPPRRNPASSVQAAAACMVLRSRRSHLTCGIRLAAAPGLRASAVTACPASHSTRQTSEPMKPLPPRISTRIDGR